MVELTPRKKDWADDDSEDDGDLARQFGTPLKSRAAKGKPEDEDDGDDEPKGATKDDAPVASLLSRIGDLSTEADTPSSPSKPNASSHQSPPPSHTIPASRPKPNTASNLFGKALAGVKTGRPPSSSRPAADEGKQPQEETKSGEVTKEVRKTGKMSADLMDNDDGWGPAPGDQKPSSGFGGFGQPSQGAFGKPNGGGSAFDQSSFGQKANGAPPQSNGDGGWGGQQNGAVNGDGPVKGQAPAQAQDDGWGGNNDATPPTPKNEPSESLPADGPEAGGSGLISNDFQVEVKLADLQADPNNPLYSAKSFEDLPLHDLLKKGVYAAGFKKPSKIQERALPLLLTNPARNFIGQSQSGTGKTAAFTLNMLSRVDPDQAMPQAICLAPSRELARQIEDVVKKIGQFTSIKTRLAIPGSWARGDRLTEHILIGTPGTFVDMLSKRVFDPKNIRVFVLDEADDMIGQQGLGDQTSRIKRTLPKGVQNVLFSATFPDEVRDFADSIAPEANQIYLKKEEVTVEAIKQLYLECDSEAGKYEALSALYDCMTIGQSIVFCRRRDTADFLAQRLTADGHAVAALHGTKETTERDAVLDGFRDGRTKVLITTNVIARGIDIQQVNMVVNYDVPTLGPEEGFGIDIQSYIHRIGRTGRFGRKGCSVIFAHDQRSRNEIEEIQRVLDKPMRRIDATSSADMEQLEKALKAAMKGPN